MIYSQPIVWTTRKIKHNQQHYIEKEASVDLYKDEVVTPFERFTIKEIHDVSYRPLPGKLSFFYLHTVRGVYTYRVKSSPEEWIAEYKKIQIK
ncbi:hypothetical protein [Halobacillus campisalis]|uniref:KTSC domain-containing protein n=1 Tax=Halobacillus campisalis TaxID=435909 RepID=A0ABW2K1A9_9BACI|nr:hypothetical protein [Halobacillus campisalis]